MTYPSPSPGYAPPSPSPAPGPTNGMPTLPDGTPDYGAGGSGAGGGNVPVDTTGAIDVWNLPQWILDYEKTNKKPFVWGYDTSFHAHQSPQAARNAREGADMHGAKPPIDRPLDVNASAEEIMKQFAAMAYTHPQEYVAMQQALADAGWVAGMKVTGNFDRPTEDALATAMMQYLKTAHGAGVPVNFKDFLMQSAANNQTFNPANGGGSGGLPSRPVLTDPDTLKRYAEMAAQAALGRNLKPGEVQKFIDQFHNEQMQGYNDALKGNGAMVDKSDPRASAIQFVTGGNAHEFQQHQIQGYTDAFLNMFLPSGSSAPNMNVDPSAVSY